MAPGTYSRLQAADGGACARQVFIAIAVFLGDGIYNLLKTIFLSVQARDSN